MNNLQRPVRAFTLIELLIVVAIIAILAAIAVPNFLEAQTRAKVSRAQSDMRTIALAVEAYTVDYNKPPSTQAPGAPNNTLNVRSVFGGNNNGVSSRLIRVTTPVAYMTSVFRDGFINPAVGVSRDPNGQPQPEYDTYDYVCSRTFLVPSDVGSRWSEGPPGRGASISSGATWHINSSGPDLKNCFGGGFAGQDPTFNACGVDYDPSNGTTSDGDIVRVGGGPGQLPGNLPKYDRVQNKIN